MNSIDRAWVETNLKAYIVRQRIVIEDLRDYIEVLERSMRQRKASEMFPLPPPA